jgi:cysteine desulfuration protein SufE
MDRLGAMIKQFQEIDFSFRLELLIDYAENLPELPEKYRKAKEAGLNKIHECQTPVFLWAEYNGKKVKIIADAAPEAPTVRGYVSFLVDLLNGMTPEEIEVIPNDLLNQLGLAQHLGMMRIQGLSAILPRIKREVRSAVKGKDKS